MTIKVTIQPGSKAEKTIKEIRKKKVTFHQAVREGSMIAQENIVSKPVNEKASTPTV